MFSSQIVEVKYTQHSGNGLYVKKAVKKYETVLEIPEYRFVTFDKLIKRYPSLRQIVQDKRCVFSYCLALEHNNVNSQFRQYFATLPKHYSNPITFFKSQIMQFQNEKLVERLLKKVSDLEQNVELIRKQLNTPEINQISVAQIKHYYALIESRTLFYTTQLDPKSEVGVLVPFYDMANHTERANQQNIFALFHYQHQKYILKAYRDFEVGEQVQISYGSYNNSHFAEYYGFIPASNRNVLEVCVDLSQFSKHITQNTLEVVAMFYPNLVLPNKKTLSIAATATLHIHEDGQFAQEILFNLLSMNNTHKIAKKDLFVLCQSTSESIDLQLKRSIKCKILQQLLSKYPTTLQQDIQQYQAQPSLGLEYVMLEKRQLNKIID